MNKSILIAAVMTALSTIPLYIISNQNVQIDNNNLLLFVASIFVYTFLATSWRGLLGQEYVANTSESSDREAGNVKWFNANKGFGFITRDSGDDVFVHFRSIRGDGHRVLRDGQRVEFTVSQGDKGLQAEDVAATS